MTKSILSIIFVFTIGSLDVFGNEGKVSFIDGVITRKHVVLQYVSKEELDVLTSMTEAYQTRSGKFLNMDATKQATFLAAAEKVETGLAHISTPEVKDWLSDVAKAKSIFRFVWSIDSNVKPIDQLLTPAQSARKEAFKAAFFNQEGKIKEIGLQVPPAPQAIDAFKRVFYNTPQHVDFTVELPMM
ncbi:MAG: hypothetical protein ACK4UP_04180 [Spirosomataceae bacterium]